MTETKTIAHWIDGRPDAGEPDRFGDVFDPATGRVTGRVSFATAADVDRAVELAAAALPGWRETSLTARAAVMFKLRELLEASAPELARVISSEHGKVVADSMGEIRRAIDVVDFACGIPHLLKGEFAENVSTNVNTYSLRQPVGVVAGITPFNFPVMVPMWMIPIALACGNAFVLKPSEKDPSTSLMIAELLGRAGVPDGVFNVVQGDRVAVDALLDHPKVAAVSSVGSTPVARHIHERASAHGKRVQALGGAKNHMVVLPDCDMDLAADSAVSAGYGSSGQRCMAISAIVAVGAAADPLMERIRERVERLRIGAGTDADADMGPLVTGDARDRVVSMIEQGVRQGAALAIDGRDRKVEGHEDGFFVGPTVFDHVRPDMTIYREEIFGPVLVILRAEGIDEAIDIVNANEYGNGTAIFTNDGGAARRFEHEIQVGMVGINVPIPVPLAFFSFGGWKHSLFGDSNIHGPEGVRFYTRSKVVTTRWPEPAARGVDLQFPGSRRAAPAGSERRQG